MPKTKPKVAIITRTKGRSALLARALESVAAQTYKDYVHVIVNDGDDPKELEKFLAKHPAKNRVVVHSPKFIGLVKVLNLGVRAAESEYVAIHDDDDTWAPERLEKTIPFMDETQAKAVVVKMDVVIEEIAEDGTINKLSQALHPESGEGEISLFKQCYKNYLSNGVTTYRRDVYEELGGYDESLKTAEDWDFGIRLMMKYDVEFIRDGGPLFFYHQRPKQKGAAGNSVHADVYQQERTINIIRNRYLRADLQAGKLGVGYIMNSIPNDLSSLIRLEGHMNHVGQEIKDTMYTIRNEGVARKLKSKIGKVIKR
jgi:glycosyltransferase involved in cell wall biosynthesis